METTTAKRYQHLMSEQRAMIAIGVKEGRSMRSVAELVGCLVSTVSRELRRNGGREDYNAGLAAQR